MMADQISGRVRTLAEINAQIVLLKVELDKLGNDPKLATIGLQLAIIQEELIEMTLYGTYTPNP
jgi:hypothetical protein